MGQPKEKPTVEQVMRLVDELSEDERDEILGQLKLEKLKRTIAIGIEQAERGQLMDGDEVFKQMRERNAAMRKQDSQ